MWPQKELEITSRGENAPEVKLKKKVYHGNEDDEKEGYVFNLNFQDTGKVNMVYLPENQSNQPPPSQVPGWLRKEKKKDKQLWGQLKHYCKTTTMYEMPYFTPIPEVKPYVPKCNFNDDIESQEKKHDEEKDKEIEKPKEE